MLSATRQLVPKSEEDNVTATQTERGATPNSADNVPENTEVHQPTYRIKTSLVPIFMLVVVIAVYVAYLVWPSSVSTPMADQTNFVPSQPYTEAPATPSAAATGTSSAALKLKSTLGLTRTADIVDVLIQNRAACFTVASEADQRVCFGQVWADQQGVDDDANKIDKATGLGYFPGSTAVVDYQAGGVISDTPTAYDRQSFVAFVRTNGGLHKMKGEIAQFPDVHHWQLTIIAPVKS